MVDPHDQMEITRLKWSKIASELNLSGHSPLRRNGMAFKDKWGCMYGDLKWIFDYMNIT